jgi:predicted nucleotidyltransferase
MQKDLRVTLKRKLPALKRLFANDPRVLGVWLFGSQAEGTATRYSDIDLGVLFMREVTLDEHLTLEAAIDAILGSGDFDVVDVQRVKLPLCARIVTGKVLYERDYAQVSDFIERTLIAYQDYALFLARYYKDYFEGMRKDYVRFRPQTPQRTARSYGGKSAAARNTAR